eukprot:2278999-Pleurochrysis_carterae.AAC.2
MALGCCVQAATGFGNNVIGSMWADDALGALLDHLRTNDELDKTLVLFTMDHGVGGKSSLYETGVRIAVFARLPSIFPPNTVSDTLLTNMDWAPTMYNLALSRSALSANEQPAQYWDGSDLLDEGALHTCDCSWIRQASGLASRNFCRLHML